MNWRPELAYVGTCDSGECLDDTCAIVWTDSGGWLSMCSRHAMDSLSKEAESPRKRSSIAPEIGLAK